MYKYEGQQGELVANIFHLLIWTPPFRAGSMDGRCGGSSVCVENIPPIEHTDGLVYSNEMSTRHRAVTVNESLNEARTHTYTRIPD